MRREWRLRSTQPHPPARALSARNGIFGCGDQAPEIAERDNELPQRLKRRRTDSGNPDTNGLLEPDGKIPSSAELGGGGCSPAKPVSRNREFFEIFRPEQASDALMAADRSNFGRNPNQLRKSYGTLLLLC